VLRAAFPEEGKAIDPIVFELMKKYEASPHAYAQGDSTLPASNAQYSGLLALQHGIGCYNPGPQTPNTPVRNEAVLSMAQLLKREGFLTFGSTVYTELSADYGCARGFDSYINLDTGVDPVWPDLENAVIPALEATKNADSFHYAHIDLLLHVPYANARFAAFSGVHNVLDLADRKRRVNLYVNNLNKMFWHLHVLDSYIERNKDKADFLVLITGDHGHGLEPWWGNHRDYALYEQRVRVPFLKKDFTGVSKVDNSRPTNASLGIFKNTLEFAGIKLPGLIARLPQYREEFAGISISETLLHPLDEDYCLVLSDGKFKFAQLLKIDYDARKVLSIGWEKLFQYSGILPNESVDVKESFPAIFAEMKAKAAILVSESLAFNAKYPNKDWSVRDLLSPSAANRRAKKIKKA
jgi:hypothetical protein